MTVKEAIYELNFALGEIYDQVFYDDKPYEFDKNGYEALDMAYEALKQAQWIPCEERLPEDGIAVLTTTENGEVYIDQVITDPYKERYFQSNTAYDNFQVLAWMPLPKPYRGKAR